MTDTQQLLSDYVENGSETAFRELVTRYVDLVFSTALRLLGGDVHQAQDAAQTVFINLARLAATLSPDTSLGGWLHRNTCFVVSKIVRGDRRRQLRERQAAEMNTLNQGNTSIDGLAPVLDEAINNLEEEDRRAILLRFYERDKRVKAPTWPRRINACPTWWSRRAAARIWKVGNNTNYFGCEEKSRGCAGRVRRLKPCDYRIGNCALRKPRRRPRLVEKPTRSQRRRRLRSTREY